MVKVYSTPTCPYCVMAKQFLKSGQMGVPVLDVNGTIIIGFNKAQILKALGK
jgi:glutaredoxin